MARFFTVKDARYELVPVEEWTFEEAVVFQRVSGMAVGRVMEGIAEWDVNAYRGWFTICMQRTNPVLSETDLIGVNFVSVLSNIEEVEEEAPDPQPNPPTALPSKPGENGNATLESEPGSPSTPEATGIPAGSKSSA